MPARGVSADDKRLPQPRQLTGHRPHLADDLLDRDLRAQVIARDRDADAMGIQPAGEVAEKRTIQCLPVTAMDKDHDRACVVAGEKINDVARAGTVSDQARDMVFAIGGRVAPPTGEMHGVLRHPRPVVVLGLIVDGRAQGFTTPAVARISAPKLWFWTADASIRGRPFG